MTQRLSKLAEYLYNNNFEMAVEYTEKTRDGRKTNEEPEEVQLLLAKAYFLNQRYTAAIDLATRLKASRNMKVVYEAHFVEYKSLYMQGQIRP
jgi:outer membrane protein assembly factor BamD (BamD/ComL family)